MKGVSEIATAAILVGVTVVTTGVVLEVSGPAIEEMQDGAAIERSVSFMNFVDDNIRSVASEGEGSTRTVSVDFDRGEFNVDSEDDSFSYGLETSSDVVSPQTQVERGAVSLSSNAVVGVQEEEVDGEECFMMENDKIKACIQKIGAEDDLQNINSSELITYYEVKDGGERDIDFMVEVNEEFESSYGTGYSYAQETGSNQVRGDVFANINAESGLDYRVLFQLYSGADFLSIRVVPQQ